MIRIIYIYIDTQSSPKFPCKFFPGIIFGKLLNMRSPKGCKASVMRISQKAQFVLFVVPYSYYIVPPILILHLTIVIVCNSVWFKWDLKSFDLKTIHSYNILRVHAIASCSMRIGDWGAWPTRALVQMNHGDDREPESQKTPKVTTRRANTCLEKRNKMSSNDSNDSNVHSEHWIEILETSWEFRQLRHSTSLRSVTRTAMVRMPCHGRIFRAKKSPVKSFFGADGPTGILCR